MRLSSQNLIATIGFAVLASLGCFFSFSSHCLKPLAILLTSATAEATLDDRYQERTTRRSGITMTAYNVTYTFTVDGKAYGGSSAIDTQPSKTMPVAYLPSDPNINGMELRGNAWFDLVIFLVPAGVLLVSLLALLIHFRSPETPALE